MNNGVAEDEREPTGRKENFKSQDEQWSATRCSCPPSQQAHGIPRVYAQRRNRDIGTYTWNSDNILPHLNCRTTMSAPLGMLLAEWLICSRRRFTVHGNHQRHDLSPFQRYLREPGRCGHLATSTWKCVETRRSSRHVITFFSGEYMPPLGVVQRVRECYGGAAIYQSQVSDWIRQGKPGWADLATIVSSGRAPDESFTMVIANKSRATLTCWLERKASILHTPWAFLRPQ
jgi:hypothetical protein